MAIDIEQLRKHYASLTDEALLEIERDELTEAAQKCLNREIERRGLEVAPEEEETADDVDVEATNDEFDADGETFMVTSFADYGGSAAADAEDARRALEAAGIPSEIKVEEIAPEPPPREKRFERQVIVPAALGLVATSVLDKAIFNPKMEEDWKMHLSALSDDELQTMNADLLCAGFLDRAKRLRDAFTAEVKRRGL